VLAATALAGLFLGVLIGAPAGFTYAVARRGWVDRDRAKEQVRQYQKDARVASRNAVGLIGVGVVVLVVAVACVVGTGNRDGAAPGACASAPGSASRTASGPPPAGHPAAATSTLPDRRVTQNCR
jgi:hypothetical protein